MPITSPSQSVTQLYSEHHGWLRTWLRSRLGCAEQAADLAQDTFVRVLTTQNANEKTAVIDSPRSYLATIAQRVMVDFFRRRTLERAYLEALAQLPEASAISPESRALILETLHAIDAMLDGLGGKAKQAFLLSQFEGMPYQQIAERLNVSVSSVKKYIARATEHCLLLTAGMELS